MGTLAETIAADTEAYRICQARHRAAVKAYEGARQIMEGR